MLQPEVTIIKLGGSLARTPECALWLDTLAAWGGPLILVPGGGPFADCVRTYQGAMGLRDEAAHHMALLAMGQFGVALATHSNAFALAACGEELEDLLRCGRIPVWLPEKMILAAGDVPACWEVTSDSLAAWLTRYWRARRLLLIKSCDLAGPAPLSELAASGIVDAAFVHFAVQARAEIWLAGPSSLPRARETFEAGGLPGHAVLLPSQTPAQPTGKSPPLGWICNR